MQEVTFRFSRVTVIVYLLSNTAVIVSHHPYSIDQPIRINLDELEEWLQKRQKERIKNAKPTTKDIPVPRIPGVNERRDSRQGR